MMLHPPDGLTHLVGLEMWGGEGAKKHKGE